MANKSELRRLYLDKRTALSVADSADFSNRIARNFFEAFDIRKLTTIHTFIPIRRWNEVDTSKIYERLWREFPGIRTACPITNFDSGEMESVPFDATTEFITDRRGISEPISGNRMRPGEIDLILVPLVCVDAAGHRVGYGRGFYDRYLARCRPDCVKAGLSFFEPVQQILEVGAHDIPLDICITPTGLHSFG